MKTLDEYCFDEAHDIRYGLPEADTERVRIYGRDMALEYLDRVLTEARKVLPYDEFSKLSDLCFAMRNRDCGNPLKQLEADLYSTTATR